MNCDILIVEDEALIALDIKSILCNYGYNNIEIALSGEESISFCEKTKPKVILMDILLSGEKNGIDAAIEINNNIPIIFVSGNSDILYNDIISKLRPLAIFEKPINFNELYPILKNIIL